MSKAAAEKKAAAREAHALQAELTEATQRMQAERSTLGLSRDAFEATRHFLEQQTEEVNEFAAMDPKAIRASLLQVCGPR